MLNHLLIVKLQGYNCQNACILTQMPLPTTVTDFLTMIYYSYGTQPNAIVMLNEIDEGDEVSEGNAAEWLCDIYCSPWECIGQQR